MATHTFATDSDPSLFLEKDDGTGAPVRLPSGSVVLVRNADDGTPLDSTTALDLGYLSFTTTDVQGVQVSGDQGATWKGPFWSKEAREAAVKRQVDLLSSSGVLVAGIVDPVVDAHLGGDATGLVTTVAGKVDKGSLVTTLESRGAKGDGVTDDTAAIIAALNAAPAGAQATVQGDPSKTYLVSNWLTPQANTTVQGGTFKLAGSSTKGGFLINNSRITLRNLTVDLNKSQTANGGSTSGQAGVYVVASAAVAGITLDGVTVKNGWQRGIYAQATGAGIINDLTLTRCVVTDTGDRGIHVGGTDPATNTGIRIDSCTVTNPGSMGITCQGVSQARVTRCDVTGGASSTNHGIVMSATNAQATDFTVSECTVSGFTTAGKWGILATWKASRFQFFGNTVTGCAGGIDVDAEDGANLGVEIDVQATITANTVTGASNTYGIYARMCHDLTIAANTVTGTTGTAAGDGIGVSSATGVVVSGNTSRGNAGYGIALYGTASGGGHMVAGNVCSGNTKGSYSSAALPTPALFGTTSTTVPTS